MRWVGRLFLAASGEVCEWSSRGSGHSREGMGGPVQETERPMDGLEKGGKERLHSAF